MTAGFPTAGAPTAGAIGAVLVEEDLLEGKWQDVIELTANRRRVEIKTDKRRIEIERGPRAEAT